MNLLIRQIWALVRKNLLILCLRRPITTFIRAFAFPLVVVLVVCYTKDFFASPLTFGISSPHDVSTVSFVSEATADDERSAHLKMVYWQQKAATSSGSSTMEWAAKSPM